MPSFRVFFSFLPSYMDVVAPTEAEAKKIVEMELCTALFERNAFPYANSLHVEDTVIEIPHTGYDVRCTNGRCSHEKNGEKMPAFRVFLNFGYSCVDVIARTAFEAQRDVEREIHEAIFEKGMFPFASNFRIDNEEDGVIEIAHVGYSAGCDKGNCPHEKEATVSGRPIRKMWDLPDDERKTVGRYIKRRLEAET